eukprot:scaffold6899_cov141-Isochrysis_galbana.AAC.1
MDTDGPVPDVETESQTEECQAAIEALKTAMTSEPVLMPPREDKPFIVKTDGASTLGIGGVLTQKDDDGRERVVAYYGRALHPGRGKELDDCHVDRAARRSRIYS